MTFQTSFSKDVLENVLGINQQTVTYIADNGWLHLVFASLFSLLYFQPMKLKFRLTNISQRDAIICGILVLLAALLFLPFLGTVHLFDWDEINFAEISREMLVTGNVLRVQIDFEPFWEKPPLFFWIQSACMAVFGINEFAARLPNALLGCLTLPLLYSIGKYYYNRSFGILWACMYTCSFLPHFYFKSGIIDPLFNLFIMLGIWHLARMSECLTLGSLSSYTVTTEAANTTTASSSDTPTDELPDKSTDKPESSHEASSEEPAYQIIYQTKGPKTLQPPTLGLTSLAGLCIGLAILTKGPVGLLLAVLTWSVALVLLRSPLYHKHAQQQTLLPLVEFPLFITVALGVACVWFGAEVWNNGFWFVQEFLRYQLRLLTTGDSGHSQPFFYHGLVLLVGCFPASVLAFGARRALQAVRAPLARAYPEQANQPAHSTSQTLDAERTLGAERFAFWMLSILLVVLVVFTIVRTKIVHYSSLAYFPLTYFAALTAHQALNKPALRILSRKIALALGVLGIIWGVLLIAIPLIGMNTQTLLPFIRDEFAKANLQANVPWTGWELCIGIFYGTAAVAASMLAWNRRIFEMTLTLFTAGCCCIFTFLVVVAPNIEAYSQRAAIEFYQGLHQKHGHEFYVKALGFKTYADLFYTQKLPSQSPRGANIPTEDFELWLLEGVIDKPAYFVCKITSAASYRERMRNDPEWRELYTKNGFVFFCRMPQRRPHLAFER
jgi:4-amino-4-deoxy-L-arabinose transferase-like glycosyltransferase